MTVTETATVDVRELARGIAADIRKYGHFQAPRDSYKTLYDRADTYPERPGPCCLLANPTMRALNKPETRDVFYAAEGQLLKALGVWEVGLPTYSDNTPTDVLLAQLDAIANGETTK